MSHPDAVAEPAHRLCVNVERCERGGALCGLARRHGGGSATMRCIGRGERVPPGDDHRLLVHTVHSGVVALCAGLTDGRRQIVALATAGEPLCTCSGLAHECWLEALAPSVLCVVDLAADDAAVLRRDNEMLNALLRASHERLESTLTRLLSLGPLDGTERACSFLADLARRLGRPEADGWRVPLPLTRQDIADYLGLKPETVSRILGRIRREGLVRFVSRGEFLVPDLAALDARCPVPPRRATRCPTQVRHAAAPADSAIPPGALACAAAPPADRRRRSRSGGARAAPAHAAPPDRPPAG